MRAESVHWSKLPKGSRERAIARIAHRANADTIFGGASALVLANRAESMGLASADDMRDAVSETYSRSSGRPAATYSAWECSECGQIHLGRTAAESCCTWEDDCDE